MFFLNIRHCTMDAYMFSFCVGLAICVIVSHVYRVADIVNSAQFEYGNCGRTLVERIIMMTDALGHNLHCKAILGRGNLTWEDLFCINHVPGAGSIARWPAAHSTTDLYVYVIFTTGNSLVMFLYIAYIFQRSFHRAFFMSFIHLLLSSSPGIQLVCKQHPIARTPLAQVVPGPE